MFNYALLGKAKPSTEGSEMMPGEVDGSQKWNSDNISAGAYMYIMTDIFRGIAYSLSNFLNKRGESKDGVRAKLLQILNLAVANGDIDEGTKNYIMDCGYSANVWSNISDLYKFEEQSGYSSMWDIVDCSCSGVSSAAECTKSFQDKMSDAERELLSDFRRKRDEYYEAKNKYERYVHNNAIIMINDVFIKYADTLTKIAKEWYDDCEKPLKDWVDRAKRELSENGQKNTADRPTPVS